MNTFSISIRTQLKGIPVKSIHEVFELKYSELLNTVFVIIQNIRPHTYHVPPEERTHDIDRALPDKGTVNTKVISKVMGSIRDIRR